LGNLLCPGYILMALPRAGVVRGLGDGPQDLVLGVVRGQEPVVEAVAATLVDQPLLAG